MNLPFLKKDIFKTSREMPVASPIHPNFKSWSSK